MPRRLLGELGVEELARSFHTRSVPMRAGSSANSLPGPCSSRVSISVVSTRDVAARLRLAVVERAHAVADFEADVPEERQKPADRLVRAVRCARDAESGGRCRIADAARRGRSRRRRRDPRSRAAFSAKCTQLARMTSSTTCARAATSASMPSLRRTARPGGRPRPSAPRGTL